MSEPPDPSVHPIRPMLPADGAVPTGSAWAFEFVWDGLRAIAYLRSAGVRLLSASDRSITSGYPELGTLTRLADTHGPLVLDGKIVTLDRLGRPNVVPLRQRMSTSTPSAGLLTRAPATFYISDVLYAHGRSTLQLPYRRRRELLEELELTGLPAELPPYFVDTDGHTVLHAARRHGLPGVLAKRLDSRYQPGRRTRAWVQTLPRHSQSVVVGGWLGKVGTSGPAALLVGIPGRSGLRYLGRVSTGLDRSARAELSDRLDGLGSAECPFDDPPSMVDDVHWLVPALVGEVSYRRWRTDGRLRQASWLGLRPDAHPASALGPLVLTAVPGSGGANSDEWPDDVPPSGELPGAEQSGAQARSSAGSSGAQARSGAGELAALDEAVRLAQAEVRALRAQISPHFLYNALTTVASYVRTDPNRARELLHDFAEYTRYSFRAGAEATTLGAELANAERYLALECARFGDRLRVEREVAPELFDVALPFLTVLGLVENAVRHGIEGTPRGGTVRIIGTPARTDEKEAGGTLTVSEDATVGVGMDPLRLAEAVDDVRERLAAAPGPVTTVQVQASPDTGTSVTLRLPADPGRLNR